MTFPVRRKRREAPKLTSAYFCFQGTYYGNYPTGRGACTLDPLSPMATQPGWIRVAAGPKTFQRSLGCGMCLEIKGSGQGSGNNPIVGKRKAVIVDYCAAGCESSKGYPL